MKKKEIERILLNNTTARFKWISPGKIYVAQWVRMKCLYGCSDSGKSCCPPNTPSIEECRNFIREYRSAVIIQHSFKAEKNNYPVEMSKTFSVLLRKIETDLFKTGLHKVFLLDQECCNGCNTCGSSFLECRNPGYRRPSAEALGIDVYKTVRSAGLPIGVIDKEISHINRYAIILLE